ncbi:uncharacterized protein V1513DRAFT_426551 [Lipomyces chichibuensis]|uniref:uncharacterized protein n=1 Tax=Lipomyces chichibuensis TaxID=1546026 RepID=UPI003343006E
MCLFCCSADIILILLAILFPPLPVWIKRGICSVDSLINIALCMLGFIPGLLHSWYIIARFPEEPFIESTDLESQDYSRRHQSAPGFTTFYSRQQFVYSPIPQQVPNVFSHNSPAPAAQAQQQTGVYPPAASVPVQPAHVDSAAGPSNSDAVADNSDTVPPPYEEINSSSTPELHLDNKVQRDDY